MWLNQYSITVCTAPCPGQHELFRVSENSFLEAPQVVQFRATALHCYNGMDNDDASTDLSASGNHHLILSSSCHLYFSSTVGPFNLSIPKFLAPISSHLDCFFWKVFDPTNSFIRSIWWLVLHSAPYTSRYFLCCDWFIITKLMQCHQLMLGCCQVAWWNALFSNHQITTLLMDRNESNFYCFV